MSCEARDRSNLQQNIRDGSEREIKGLSEADLLDVLLPSMMPLYEPFLWILSVFVPLAPPITIVRHLDSITNEDTAQRRHAQSPPCKSRNLASVIVKLAHDASLRAPHRDPLVLPLSSTLATSIPQHPLLHLLASPVFPRLAHIESLVLTSFPSTLLRRLGFSARAIVLVALVSLGGAVRRYRGQWRVMLGLLGVVEALSRTCTLLDGTDEEREREEGPAPPRQQGNAAAARHLKREQLVHVLSWWLLLALVTLAESIHASTGTVGSTTTTVFARLAPHLRRLRRALLPLVARFPSLYTFLNSKLPATRRPFPQPLPPTSRRVTLPTPLLFSLFGSEVRYRLVKLLVLWNGLRTDGWGASVLWDWGIGPLFAVRRKRGGASEGITKRRVINVVLSEVEKGGRNVSPGQDVFGSQADDDDDDSTTSPSPHRGSSTRDASFESTSTSSTFSAPTPLNGSPFGFPTPNVPFRLASSAHPLHGARSSSTPSIFGYQTQSPSLSPSPMARSSSGGYDVEEIQEAAGATLSWDESKRW